MKNNELYNFVHIPKCAGSTIRKNVQLNFSSKKITEVYSGENSVFENRTGIDKHFQNVNKDLIRINFGHDVFFGIHELFPNRDSKYITFFRDPFERIISYYNYHRTMLDNGVNIEICENVLLKDGKIMDFGDEWLTNNNLKTSNRITSFLYSRFFGEILEPKELSESVVSEICSILDKFYFIGLTENKEDINYFYHLLSLKRFRQNDNVSKSYFIPQDYEKLKKKLYPLYKYDLQLYEFAETKNIQFKKEHPSFENDTLKIESKINKYNKRRVFYRNCKLKFKKIIRKYG